MLSPKCRTNINTRIADRSFENVEVLRWLVITETNKNFILEKINIKFNSGNPCYHSVKNILFYRLPSKSVKIKVNKTVILPVVLYGSFALREKHRLRAFKKKDEIMRRCRKLRNDELRNSYSLPCMIRKIKANVIGRACSKVEKRARRSVFWWEDQKEEE
jgi:hypothetical protein